MSVTIEQVSVGFDTYANLISSAVNEGSSIKYPPYNIRKTANNEYAIDIDASGFHYPDIEASIQDGYLQVKSANAVLPIFHNDDVFFNKGIVQPEDFSAKFWVADGLALANAVYQDGIITFTFAPTGTNKALANVAVTYAQDTTAAPVTPVEQPEPTPETPPVEPEANTEVHE
jgi:HSP20 family molecular chaperone IbpA